MTYVRKTETLVSEMLNNISSMQATAKAAYPPTSIDYGTPLFESARGAVSKAAYRDAPQLEGKLPAAWLSKHSRVTVKFPVDCYPEDILDRSSNVDTTQVAFPEHDQISLPFAVRPRYDGAEVTITADDCDDLLRSFFDVAALRQGHLRRITKQFAEVREQIQIFMAGYSSLNAAVKVMPEIELYVPEHYMTKLREPAPSRAAKNSSILPESLGIDRDMLASIAIGHRITKP